MWLTYKNLDRYFEGWNYFLLAEGFAEDEIEIQPNGATAKVTISPFNSKAALGR